MPLWTCPQCNTSVRGLKRPRRNSVTRYCLECSGKAGILVERICPAQQRKSERRTEASSAKKKSKAEKAAAKEGQRFIVGGQHDARYLYKQFRMLNCFIGYDLPENHPIKVLRPLRNNDSVTGRAGTKRLLIRATDKACSTYIWIKIQEVMLHEMCHVALIRAGNTDYHGDLFRGLLWLAAREHFCVEVPMPVRGERGNRANLAYELDARIIKAATDKATAESETV